MLYEDWNFVNFYFYFYFYAVTHESIRTIVETFWEHSMCFVRDIFKYH